MLSKVLSVDQDNYPEMLGHTCIINAGGIVSILFRFVKPLLDIRTQNKIEVRAGRQGQGQDLGHGSSPGRAAAGCWGHRARASSMPTWGADVVVLVLRQL